jgi:dihydrofolate reductase
MRVRTRHSARLLKYRLLPGRKLTLVAIEGHVTSDALKNRFDKLFDAELASALLKAGLIDEVRLFINPKKVKAGTSIYNRRPAVRRWILAEAAIYDCGIVYRKYLLLDRR